MTQIRKINGITLPSSIYTTGFTYNGINTFEISDTDGNSYSASINSLSASTISATTFYGDGSNITGVNAFATFSSTTIGQGSVVADNSEDLISYSGINIDVFTDNTNKIITFSGSTGGGGSGVATDPIWDVEGDLVVATGADAAVRIPIGSAGTFLRSNATTAAWSVVSFPNAATTGDIIYASSTNNYDNLSPGTAGHVLTSNGAGSAPSYQATSGEANIGNNVGGGNEVFKSKTGTSLNFRTLVAGANIAITSGETTLTISGSTGGGGEVNTASNVGTGEGLFSGKSGVDLQFKSLTSTGGTVTISSTGSTVNLEASGGGGNATVDNFYYSISNSVDTRPIFEDTNVLFNWDETGNDLEFQMKVAPGGSGDMRSLAYIVGGSTQNTFIVSTGVNYDVYAAGVSAGNRLEVFITPENDVTYPAYHVTVYNTGESVQNTVWIQRITRN